MRVVYFTYLFNTNTGTGTTLLSFVYATLDENDCNVVKQPEARRSPTA